MRYLKEGQRVELYNGGSVVVEKFLGSGGQGLVYSVRCEDGNTMALKWYHHPSIIADDKFYENLRTYELRGISIPTFIWPRQVTERTDSFGYLMELRPAEYIELGNFFCIDKYPQAYFRSEYAKITAALQLAFSFAMLHQAGYSFKDINDGNLFVDPYTGNIKICDTDNVVPAGSTSGIVGKPRYIASEVLHGKRPDHLSDRLSLAIILYRILMLDHPFDGAVTARYASLLTPELESKFFGTEAIFCYDPERVENRPIPEVHPNSDYYWHYITEELRSLFKKAFSSEALSTPMSRVSSMDWTMAFARVRADMIFCKASPEDEMHDFLAEETVPQTCPICLNPVEPFATLEFDDDTKYRLCVGKLLFIGPSLKAIGTTVKATNHNGGECISLKNISKNTWIAEVEGQRIEIPPESVIPVKSGTNIDFGILKAKIVFPGY